MSASEAFSAFRKSDYAQAISLFDTLLVKNPQDSLLLSNRAHCFFKLDLFRKALADCQAAITINPAHEGAFLLKGKIQWSVGQKELAIKTWEKGLTICRDLGLHLELQACIQQGPTSQQPLESPSPVVQSKPALGPPSPAPSHTPKPSSQPSSPTPGKSNLSLQPSKVVAPILDSVIGNEKFDQLAQAAVGQIQHGIGDIKVDKFIAAGYYHINSGQIAQGKKIFDELLKGGAPIIAAYLGRGTGHALEGAFDEAIADFSMAIKIDSKCTDAYKRRGQTRAARGFIDQALDDFDMAIQQQPDAEGYRQRGLIYYRKKNFKRALVDFKQASRLDHQDAGTWNHMGLCYDSLGDCQQAVESHKKALSMDPQMKEAWVNLGQAYKDWGKYEEAMENFNKALKMDSKYGHAYHLRGITQHGVGKHFLAQIDLEMGFQNTKEKDCAMMNAVTKTALGMMGPALASFEKALAIDPQNACWYQKEVMLWYQRRLDKPFNSFNPDAELDPEFKEFNCKRHPPRLLKTYKAQPPMDKSIPDVHFTPKAPSPEAAIILKYSVWYGKLLHNSAPGYLSNARQQRMAALATLDAAQRLKAFWKGERTTVDGPGSSLNQKPHPFGWRDVFDVMVRWRQISEPNDAVWWVDLLTKEQFSEGFGSHTPMITGQCNVVRYSPMVKMSFPIMKKEIIAQKNLSDNLKKQVNDAQDVEQLYKVMRKDFWVVTPVLSIRTGQTMEGTRLTLQYSDPEGFEYSIRTPGTPPRWIDYDLELAHVFELLTIEVRKETRDVDRISELILTFAYYWYNFTPLSRGTAACGLMIITSCFLACGIKIGMMVPEKCLIDWECFLRPSPQDFVGEIKKWMWPARQPIDQNEFDQLPRVETTLDTMRKMLQAMNADIPD